MPKLPKAFKRVINRKQGVYLRGFVASKIENFTAFKKRQAEKPVPDDDKIKELEWKIDALEKLLNLLEERNMDYGLSQTSSEHKSLFQETFRRHIRRSKR